MLLCIGLIIALNGCENKNYSTEKTEEKIPSTTSELTGEEIPSTTQKITEEVAPSDTPKITEEAIKKEGIDVDLTLLSPTLVYAEVYNMMVSPKSYIGKSVKMEGDFAVYHDESADKYYFACIISDATACCSQGIEFELKGDHSYPDDYPKEGEEICVVGVFDTYSEGEYTYCTLRNASIV